MFHKFHRTRAEQLVCEGPAGARSRNEIGGCGRWSRRFPWRGLPWGQRFSEHLPAHSFRSELHSKTDYVRAREGSAILPPSDPSSSVLISCGGGGLVPKSCQLFETPRTVAYQAPLPMEFSRHEHWSGLPFPPLGDLPNPGIEPRSPMLQGVYCIPGSFFTG